MTKSRMVLLLFVALPLSQRGTVPAQAPTPLTAKDRIEINQLVARYAFALDTRDDSGMAFANLFAPDGELAAIRGSARSRDQLARLASSGVMTAEKPLVGVSHFGMNHVIEPAAGGATGKEYLVMVNIAEGGKPGGDFSDIGGHYEDAYVKTAAGWRFKRREYVPMKSTAQLPAVGGRPVGDSRGDGRGAGCGSRWKPAVCRRLPRHPCACQHLCLRPGHRRGRRALRERLHRGCRISWSSSRARRQAIRCEGARGPSAVCAGRSRLGIRAPLHDEPSHRAFAGGRSREGLPAGHRHRPGATSPRRSTWAGTTRTST